MRIQNSQLVAANVSKLEFRGKEGKFPRHFNGFFNWECASSILPGQPPIHAFGQAPQETREWAGNPGFCSAASPIAMVMMPAQSPSRSSDSFMGLASSEKNHLLAKGWIEARGSDCEAQQLRFERHRAATRKRIADRSELVCSYSMIACAFICASGGMVLLGEQVR
jgi:hypothetical protein